MNRRNWFYIITTIVVMIVVLVLIKSCGGNDQGDVETATTIASTTEVVTAITSLRFWLMTGLGCLVMVVWSVFRSFNQNVILPPVWMLGVLVGLPLVHWLLWSIHPQEWEEWMRSQTFWPLNLLVAVALVLLSQGALTVRWLGVGCLVIVVWCLFPHFITAPPPSTGQTPALKSEGYGNLSEDDILAVIAGCESGDGTPGSGRQFDNSGNLIRNPKSSAIGKYQIMSSLHKERALSLGFDIETLEGNEAYARVLLAENGTKDWEVDPLSFNCWYPKLMAAGYQVPSRRREFIVTVGPEWSEIYRYPPNMTVDYRGIGPQQRYAMQTESGEYEFAPEKSDVVLGYVPWSRFKSLTDKEEQIRVTLY